MSSEDDDILQAFIVESIEQDLLAIEKRGADIDEDLVNKVFRAGHSIKGSAGFMGLTAIQELAHVAENVLGLIRARKLVPAHEVVTALLLAVDELQHLLADVGDSNEASISSYVVTSNAITTGLQPNGAYTARLAAVASLPESPSRPVAASEAMPPLLTEELPVESTQSVPKPQPAQAGKVQAGKPETSIRVSVSLLDQLINLAGEHTLHPGAVLHRGVQAGKRSHRPAQHRPRSQS